MHIIGWIMIVASLVGISYGVGAQPAASPSNAAQEQIERTIGNLFITNTNLQAQLAQAQNVISDLKKQLEEAKKDKK